MSLPRIELGQPLEGQEERNPWGWVLIFTTIGFLLLVALSGYFSPERALQTARSQAEARLKAFIVSSSLGASVVETSRNELERAEVNLRPFVAQDETAALVYGQIRTELGEPLRSADLSQLRKAKGPLGGIAFEVLTSRQLTPARAKGLADRIPKTNFTNRLLAVEALEKAGITGARASLTSANSAAILILLRVAVVAAVGLGATLLFSYYLARMSGRLQPKGIPLDNLTPADADRLALRCGQFFFLFIAAQVVVGLAGRNLNRDWADLPVYVLIVLGVFALSQVPVGGKWISLRTLGLRSDHLGRDILWGVAGAVANAPIVLLVMLACDRLFQSLPQAEHPVEFTIQGSGSWLVMLKLVVMACVFAPFIEEIIFRATLFPALHGVWRRLLAAGIVSSLLFGMIHPTGIPAWFPLAAIGGMSCFLTYNTKSIVPSMVMHGVHNLATLIFSLAILR